MSQVTVQHRVELRTTECYLCGVIFGMPAELYGYRLNDRKTFYCPNGHGQIFGGKTEAEKLQEQLDEERRRRSQTEMELVVAQQRARSVEKEKKRVEKRVKNGACPCCNRQFVQLARHMKSKHPDYQP